MPFSIGPCRASITRWYFDTYDKVCKSFIWGGCDGNENNFITDIDCEVQCGNRKVMPDMTDEEIGEYIYLRVLIFAGTNFREFREFRDFCKT